MILINGKILSSDDTYSVLKGMRQNIIRTLQKPVLNPALVVDACDKLADKIAAGECDTLISDLKSQNIITVEQLKAIKQMFSRIGLIYKIETELGLDYSEEIKWTPPNLNKPKRKKYYPLGVLFHIAAGNIDGLPAYSVIEGLLAGNINILKLPHTDKGLTIKLLSELISIEPELSEYIYVFDTPSQDLRAMKAMADLSDGIVVWGGDEAVKTVRKLAAPGKKIIEWGHKISFAYITKKGMDDILLEDLAQHMFKTRQLLCSSCQGVFLDTENISDVYDFCEKFISIMERVAGEYPEPEVGIRAQITLQLYNKELESIASPDRIYRGRRCSIIASKNSNLKTSFMYGNCWAMPLPRNLIIPKLYHYRGYLQTAALLCDITEKKKLTDLLARAGVVRITEAGMMSSLIIGEAHDGDYPLRRYSRIVEF